MPMRNLGFHRRLVGPSDGKARGLLLMWRDVISVMEHNVMSNYTDVTIDHGCKRDVLDSIGNQQERISIRLGSVCVLCTMH